MFKNPTGTAFMKEKLYSLIESHLRDLIELNKDTPDYMLPSENQLALKLHASRVSVRRALDELEKKGEIYKIKGKGSFPAKNLNKNFRTLTGTQNDLFAFILPDFNTAFPRGIAKGVFDFAKEKNFGVAQFCTYNSVSNEEQAIFLAKKIGCKGIIIMPADEDNYNNGILSLALNKFPTILVDRYLFGLNFCCISSDHFKIGYDSGFYLAQKYSEVCIISIDDMVSSVKKRIEGFNKGAADGGNAKKHNLIVRGDFYSTIKEFFSKNRNVGGIVCNGEAVHVLYRVMTELNKKINVDYEIVSIGEDANNFDIANNLCFKTLLQDDYSIGYEAAKSLYENITEQTPIQSKTIPLFSGISEQKQTDI